MKKTNALRLLEKGNIPFETIEYKYDEDDLSAGTVAQKLGQDIDRVFKTLVLRGDKTGVFVCLIPGNSELDLKKAAKISGNKKAEMVLMKELLPLTGYIRGGCTPIGMKKPYPAFIHHSCMRFENIYISAGQRGMQIKISPESLIVFANITVTDLVL